jgi:hypothetical protein
MKMAQLERQQMAIAVRGKGPLAEGLNYERAGNDRHCRGGCPMTTYIRLNRFTLESPIDFVMIAVASDLRSPVLLGCLK